MSKILQYKLLLILSAAVLLADQATKAWVANTLEYGSFFPPACIQVIPGFFHIVHVGNTGAAWSLFSEYTWALTAVGFIALALIFVFRKALELKLTKIQFAFGLIIGGIIGNLIDRVKLGHVVDFLDFFHGDYHFPSFNVADSGITVGVFLYILASFTSQRNETATAETQSPSIPEEPQAASETEVEPEETTVTAPRPTSESDPLAHDQSEDDTPKAP